MCLSLKVLDEGIKEMARRVLKSEDGTIMSDHATLIRGRIMNSAKELLAKEGYSKTTIRKIVEHSGVLTGSIYYFFKNKEDIFRAILLELVRDCINKINKNCCDESPLFKYAAVCQVELKVLADYRIVRETYLEGYNSTIIFEGMVAQFVELARGLFDDTEYECSDEGYYQNTLMVKGAMHACLSEMFFQREVDSARTRESLLRLALGVFGAKEAEINGIVEKIRSMNDTWERIGKEMVEHPLVK